jgi:molecular chaperone DnaK
MVDTGEATGSSPETKPFEPRRPQPTRPGLQPPAAPPGAPPVEAGQPTTLMGLGRGRTKTGAGLGPEAVSAREAAPAAPPPPVPPAPPWLPPAATLLSAEREAASALDEITHRVLGSDDDEAPPTTPTSAPPESLPPLDAELLEPAEVTALDDASLPLPEIPDDVPTRVGSVPMSEAPVPPPSSGRRQPSIAPRGLAVPPPVLVDVTPLTLSVETVGGYCDALIARNTPVPCDRTRTFVTAVDNQTVVRVRVGQGESSRFGENTLLGELELSQLRAAPRGAVEIAVTFALDTNGMLDVSARDLATGRATQVQLHLVGLPEAHQLEGLAARHAAQRAG